MSGTSLYHIHNDIYTLMINLCKCKSFFPTFNIPGFVDKFHVLVQKPDSRDHLPPLPAFWTFATIFVLLISNVFFLFFLVFFKDRFQEFGTSKSGLRACSVCASHLVADESMISLSQCWYLGKLAYTVRMSMRMQTKGIYYLNRHIWWRLVKGGKWSLLAEPAVHKLRFCHMEKPKKTRILLGKTVGHSMHKGHLWCLVVWVRPSSRWPLWYMLAWITKQENGHEREILKALNLMT